MFKHSTPLGMKSQGRFKSGLKGGKQGQHATAYALVKKGFARPFSISALNPSSELETRNARRKMYLFFDAISRLDVLSSQKTSPKLTLFAPKPSKNKLSELYQSLEEAFQKYNESRTRASALKKQHQLVSSKGYGIICEQALDADIEQIFDAAGLSTEQIGKKSLSLLVTMTPAADEETAEQLKQDIGKQSKEGRLSVDSIKALAVQYELSYQKMQLHNIQQHKAEQRRHIRRFCERVAELGTAYYNTLPNVTFHHSERKSPRHDWKMSENGALLYLERHYSREESPLEAEQKANLAEISRNNEIIDRIGVTLNTARTCAKPNLEKERAACIAANKALEAENENLPRKNLINAIDGLFDYFEVSDSDAENASGPNDRTNDPSMLVTMLARHLFLFFSVYPEAAKEFKCDLSADSPDFSELIGEILFPLCQSLIQKDWPSLRENPRTTAKMVNDIIDTFRNLILTPKNSKLQDLIRSRASSTESVEAEPEPAASVAVLSVPP